MIESQVLPKIRQDLELLPAAPEHNGAPRWSVYDPIAHQYTSVDAAGFAVLSNWKEGLDQKEFIQQLSERKVELAQNEWEEMIAMMLRNGWIVDTSPGQTDRLVEGHRKATKSLFNRVLHGYLFFKVPLVKPDLWLGDLAEMLVFLRSPTLQALIIALGLLGLFSVLEQWSVFLSTFPEFVSWEGIGLYATALLILKILHEMGHAVAAKWKGVRVGSMGLAFLVLFPILYTDTTDAWRLRNRFDRLDIALAGLRVELSVGALALFLWGVSAPGPMKTLCFVIATTAVISSLLVNLTPFMRFDGYFAMTDITGIDNLQSRSFTVARWWLRRVLFGYRDPCPEERRKPVLMAMILFSYGTWIYRFFLFLGIAILVYSIDFKLLGIFLFFTEIWFFILRPVFNELKHWWDHRSAARWTISGMGCAIGGIALGLWLVYPFASTLTAPGVLNASEVRQVYADKTGLVLRGLAGPTRVEFGQVLAEIVPSENRFVQWQMNLRRAQLEEGISLLAATNQVEKRSRLMVELANLEREQQLLNQAAERFVIRAPGDGEWIPAPGFSSDQTWPEDQPIGQWVSRENSNLVAYVPIAERDKIIESTSVTFVDITGQIRDDFELKTVEVVASDMLSFPELASIYGGNLPVRPAQEYLEFEQEFVRVSLSSSNPPAPVRLAGVVHFEGRAESQASQWFLAAISLLNRESGF